MSAGADSAGEASPAPSSSTQRAQWLEEMLWWACIALCLGAASCIVLLEVLNLCRDRTEESVGKCCCLKQPEGSEQGNSELARLFGQFF